MTLALPKQEDITLNSMTQTREKWDSLVLSRGDIWVVWTRHGFYSVFILFHFFILSFRTTVKRNIWIRHSCGHFFWYYNSESYLILAVQSAFSTITRHVGMTFERNFSWVLNIMKPKWVRVRKKLSAGQKSKTVLRRTLHQEISLFIYMYI